MKLLFSITLLALCLPACSSLHSTTIRTSSINPTNGAVTSVTEKTSARVFTFFDGQANVTKFRNQSSPSAYGSNSFAPGTYATGIGLESSTTNLNEILGVVVQAVVQGAVKGAK